MVVALHCFCDASERAFATALYVVLETTEGIAARLITAKSKVAPVKVISLPKLELCSASLGIKLTCHVLSVLGTGPESIHCWTDSKIVLAWLKAHPSRWKAFVANRVSEIATSLPTAIWRHVASSDNPADLATRGISTMQFKESSLWWQGPA